MNGKRAAHTASREERERAVAEVRDGIRERALAEANAMGLTLEHYANFLTAVACSLIVEKRAEGQKLLESREIAAKDAA